MGVVFKAHAPDGRVVAIKLLKDATPERLQRFDRERRLQEQLGEESGFVPLLDAGFLPGTGPYIVLAFAGGGTLRRKLMRNALGHHDVRRLGVFLAEAIGRAHDLGIVHRDLKPENVLFTEAGRPLIADLGLAKHFDRDVLGASQSIALSVDGRMSGTVGYMAPEQCIDSRSAGPPADVFAIGTILYEALAGKAAFEAENTVALVAKVAEGRYEPLGGLAIDAPRWLLNVIERCLVKDPEFRYQDGAALAHALRDGASSASAVASTWTGIRWRPRARSVVYWLWGLALLLVLAIAAAVAVRLARPPTVDVAAVAKDALAPGRPTVAVRERLATLKQAGAPQALIASVTARLDECTASDALAAIAGKKPEEIDVTALAEAGECCARASSLPNLVGEREGLALGSALLERYAKLVHSSDRAMAARVGSAALALGEARLAAQPADPAGRALRAESLLALDASPTRAFALARPFRGFRDGTERFVALRRDLEAAAALPGEPGRRAAWLLADLLAGAGPGVPEGEIAQAIARARDKGDPDGLAPRFERILSKPVETTFKTLADELAQADEKERPAAAALLSRFLAHLGAPDGLDDPELVAGLIKRSEALQRDGEADFALPERPPFTPEPPSLLDGGSSERQVYYDRSVLTAERKDDARLARCRDLFGVVPLEDAIEQAALLGRAWSSSLALDTLVGEGAHGRDGFSWLEVRTRAMGVVLLGRDVDVGGAEVTITASNIVAFDAAFERDVHQDGILAAAVAHGLGERAALRAKSHIEGIARVAALRDNPPEPEATRLKLESVVRLSEIDRRTGIRVLSLRAQARGRAFPEPIASTLALLDYERIARSLERASTPRHRQAAAIVGVQAALEPVELFQDRGRSMSQRLARAGLFWARESAHEALDGKGVPVETFQDRVSHVIVRGALDFMEPKPEKATADDLARLNVDYRPRRPDGQEITKKK
jgi:hypothetical protein